MRSVYAGLLAYGQSLIARSPFRGELKASAKQTGDSAKKQVSRALDLSDFNPDLEYEQEHLEKDTYDRSYGYLDLSLDRADETLEEWGDLDPETSPRAGDTNALGKMLDVALLGIEGRALMSAGLAFGEAWADMNQTAQLDAGVASYIWLTAQDSRVRPAHAALQNEECRWDDPPLSADDSDSGDPCHAGEDINCVPGDSLILLNAPTTKAYRRWICGEMSVIAIESASPISTTVNHPILTRRGWLPAHLLKVGDYVVDTRSQGINPFIDYPQRSNATAEQLFRAAASIGISKRITGRTSWFHGDGADQEVDVIEIDRGLLFGFVATLAKGGCNNELAFAATTALDLGFLPSHLFALLDAAHRIVCGLRPGLTLFRRGARHSHKHRVATASTLNSVLAQYARNCKTAFAESHQSSDSQLANAILIQPNDFIFRKVEAIVRRPFVGWVYNFETITGWYGCHGTVIHNCRCVASPIPPESEELQ